MTTEGREVDPDQITQHVVHPALHQDYASDFWSWRAIDIAPTLTSPILVGIVSSMHLPERPTMPEGPETPKAQKVCRMVEKLLFSQLYQDLHT